MPSLLSCCFPRRRSRDAKKWKAIEEAATELQLRSLPSWNAQEENPLLFQGFEWHVPADGEHWTRLRRALPSLVSLGVSQIWLPPGCKGMDRNGNGYDIYDLYDLGEFEQKSARETKFGSREKLQELVDEAKRLGVGVVWDAVLNHKAGADRVESCRAVMVNPERRTADISNPTEIDAWTAFDFAGRGDKYSSMKYNRSHFSGVDWDDKSRKNAIYRILSPSRNAWADDVSHEKGNYDYLMFANLDFSHPEVREDLLHWASWITSQLSLSGMRFDAAKHFSSRFQRDCVQHVRKTVNPDFFVIGEYWTGNIKELIKYLEDMQYTVSAYDVPLVNNFSKISKTQGADMRTLFDGTLVQQRPDHAVTIVTNHDTQPGQMMDTPISPPFKLHAYTLTLLRKSGLPSLFYGDLYGILSNVGKPLTPACKGALPLLARARKHFAYGEQQDYFDEPHCVGFVRYGNGHHRSGLACVLSNAGAATKRMYVGLGHSREVWIDILRSTPGSEEPFQGQDRDQPAKVIINERGYGEFPVPARGVSIWIEMKAARREEIGLWERL
ncbi:alpha-amylase [Aspergillus lucknowensis]|uniref:Glycoside hydrolase superfamily n=1 Tax=Aspergillus lucknowensis TaxID=176173 RepID=A0ABR4M4E3_9EURO